MNSKAYHTHNQPPAKLFLEMRLVTQREVIIDRCLAKLPATALSNREDRQLFVNMVSAILEAPVERCYQYAQ